MTTSSPARSTACTPQRERPRTAATLLICLAAWVASISACDGGIGVKWHLVDLDGGADASDGGGDGGVVFGSDAGGDGQFGKHTDAGYVLDAGHVLDAGRDASALQGDAGMDAGASSGTTDGGNHAPGQYAIGGSVSGLGAGATLVLQNNGGDNLTISGDGSFQFPTLLESAATYTVTVLTQPSSPSQTCIAMAGSGTVGSQDVTSVVVECTTNRFSLGGTVSGLSGSVTLQNGADHLVISADGAFAFATPVLSGANYDVTVLSQPASVHCVVSGGSGTVGGADVASVTVNCTPNTYTVGGTISGLAGGSVILANNGGDQLTVSANGSFAFATPVHGASSYAVTVAVQPTGQVCSVQNGSGTVAAANVTSVQVTCVTSTYRVGGSLVGLAGGATLVLQNNGGDNLSLTANGSFAFPMHLASGSSYNVTILTQPAGATCTVSGGSGSIGSSDVTSVVVNCASNSFTVGGTISGLTGNVVIQNNGGDNLTLSANGSFAFPTPLTSGSSYTVTVQKQPKGQTCQITNGSGSIATSNVTSVSIECVPNTYSLGGSISGLKGNLILANNGANFLHRKANGSFTFTNLVASGAVYNVTVQHQPAGQKCTVQNGAGVVGSGNVTNVMVTCVPKP